MQPAKFGFPPCNYSYHQINDEPASEVVHCDFGWGADNLVILTDISGAEVNEYINDEHNINH